MNTPADAAAAALDALADRGGVPTDADVDQITTLLAPWSSGRDYIAYRLRAPQTPADLRTWAASVRTLDPDWAKRRRDMVAGD